MKQIIRILRVILFRAYKAGYYDCLSHKAIDDGFEEYFKEL